MADLSFTIDALVHGSGKDREGAITANGETIRYSVPATMGGKGVGMSPETLLLGAVTACYSLTLLYYLQRKRLAVTELAIKTEGIVTGHPQNDRYARIIVNPTVHGGERARLEEYRAAAVEARDNCFIGQTVAAGQVAYEVGTVEIIAHPIEQQAISGARATN